MFRLVPAIDGYRTPDASKSQLSTFISNHYHRAGTSGVHYGTCFTVMNAHKSVQGARKMTPLRTPQADNIQTAMAANGAISVHKVNFSASWVDEGGIAG